MSDLKPAREKLATAMCAANPEESHRAYSKWAKEYDEDLASLGGCAAVVTTVAEVLMHIKNDKSTLLLDLAAGTGRVGQSLCDQGFEGIMDALDANEAMLKEAENKGIYRKCIQCEVKPDQPLLVSTNSYDVATVSGAFYTNHLQQECLVPITDCLKPGGILAFNTRMTDANQQYKKKLDQIIMELEKSGRIEVINVKKSLLYHETNDDEGGALWMQLYIYRKL